MIGSLVAPVAGIGPVTGAAAAPGAACSGPHLVGHHFSSAEISGFAPGHLRCADLAGSDFSDLSLVQIDLTNANLHDADLRHADLTQATLTGADLSGANLSDATLDQATAHGATFAGANLSGASLVQTDLTGADLDGANLGGTTFTQAELGQATFNGVTGVPPWSLYLLIASAALFLLLAWRSVRRRIRRAGGVTGLAMSPGMGGMAGMGAAAGSGGMPGMPGMGGVIGMNSTPVRVPRGPGLVRGLLGSLIAAFGIHLFAGGLLDEFVGGFSVPLHQTCSGPLCVVGVASGFFGLFGGIIVAILGFGIRAGN
jgi:uncharacterized protein YjbI with pentapeptide repeats